MINMPLIFKQDLEAGRRGCWGEGRRGSKARGDSVPPARMGGAGPEGGAGCGVHLEMKSPCAVPGGYGGRARAGARGWSIVPMLQDSRGLALRAAGGSC